MVRVLDELRDGQRTPERIQVDHGPEFVSQVVDQWAYKHGVTLAFIRPGKPTDNAYVESFNGTFRAECLNAHWFATLSEARQMIREWRREYNESRPHRAHGERTPDEFASCRELTFEVIQKKRTAQNRELIL